MIIPRDILVIHASMTEAGHKLYIVGGAVRDHLLGKEPVDFDLATDAMPDVVMDVLSDYELDLTGKAFGVVRVRTKNFPKGIEIATFREDITSGRNPDVKLGVTIEEDANRRDLTINALFYDISEGKILDFVDGVNHLERRHIVTPGNPLDRFNEDGLRVIRSIRFKARIAGTLDPSVASAISVKNPKMESINAAGEKIPVAQERIREEFLKGLEQAVSPWSFVIDLIEHDLIQEVFPGIVKTGSVVIDSRRPEFVIAGLMLGRFSETTTQRGRGTITKYLVETCKFSEKDANGAVLLMRSLSKDTGDIFDMHKFLRRTNLTFKDVATFVGELGGDHNYISALTKYEPSMGPENFPLLSSAELGLEIRRAEKEIFEKLLNN